MELLPIEPAWLVRFEILFEEHVRSAGETP